VINNRARPLQGTALKVISNCCKEAKAAAMRKRQLL